MSSEKSSIIFSHIHYFLVPGNPVVLPAKHSTYPTAQGIHLICLCVHFLPLTSWTEIKLCVSLYFPPTLLSHLVPYNNKFLIIINF